MIDKNTIDDIFNSAKIEEVVGDFVNLKKRGVNLIGLCPFHDEKTPSFIVSPSKNICKCFGCGKGGNAVNFMMELEQFSYPEALKYLAKKYNIEVAEASVNKEQLERRNQRESMLLINSFSQKQFSEWLENTSEGKIAGLAYLKERGFKVEILKKFQIGYSPDQRDALIQTLEKSGYDLSIANLTGIVKTDEGKRYDRFRGRIMFPIHGIAGKIVGFGGRIIKNNDKQAKYLNSPESEIYHKSNVLYGLYFAKQSIIKNDVCYLVEGYTDVLALHQSGIENVVASSGTALSINQIRMIKRFTQNIIFIFDGDSAGIKASLRGIDLILSEDMNIKVLPLPEGEDPDSFSRKISVDEFTKYVQNRKLDFIHFKASILKEEASKDPIKKAQMIQEMVRSIAVIPNAINRSVYIRECNALLEVKEEMLYTEVNRFRAKSKLSLQQENKKVENTAPEKVERKYAFDIQERAIIRLIMRYGEEPLEPGRSETVGGYLISELEHDGLKLNNPIYAKVIEEYKGEFPSEKGRQPEWFFTHHESFEIAQLAAELCSDNHQLSRMYEEYGDTSKGEKESLFNLVPKAILEYKLKYVELELKSIQKQLKENQEKGEENFELIKEFLHAKNVHGEIMKMLGNRIVK